MGEEEGEDEDKLLLTQDQINEYMEKMNEMESAIDTISHARPRDKLDMVYWIGHNSMTIRTSTEKFLSWSNSLVYREMDKNDVEENFRTIRDMAVSILRLDVKLTRKWIEKAVPIKKDGTKYVK